MEHAASQLAMSMRPQRRLPHKHGAPALHTQTQNFPCYFRKAQSKFLMPLTNFEYFKSSLINEFAHLMAAVGPAMPFI